MKYCSILKKCLYYDLFVNFSVPPHHSYLLPALCSIPIDPASDRWTRVDGDGTSHDPGWSTSLSDLRQVEK